MAEASRKCCWRVILSGEKESRFLPVQFRLLGLYFWEGGHYGEGTAGQGQEKPRALGRKDSAGHSGTEAGTLHLPSLKLSVGVGVLQGSPAVCGGHSKEAP
ncbi:Hypothetical predicted protein [Marmota monax]|uniref:Uncharacterized protein n=1 Tax=Marmota monax TaxID=9995 RepID=A0A5E4CXF9_MARMO|nr:Hypothetical predicted protein [Marmota monax]